MSAGSRIAIGLVALLGAVGFFLTARDPSGLPSEDPFLFYGLAAAFVVIAIACFFPKSHPVTLRLIGGLIFVAGITNVILSFSSGGLLTSIVGLIIWGPLSVYLMIKGKLSVSGSGSEDTNGQQNQRKS